MDMQNTMADSTLSFRDAATEITTEPPSRLECLVPIRKNQLMIEPHDGGSRRIEIPHLHFGFDICLQNNREVICVPTLTGSDPHWGALKSRSWHFLRALKNFSADEMVLIGDGFDGDAISRWKNHGLFKWCRQAIAEILRMQADGMKLIYITGNHDEALQRLWGKSFLNIDFAESHTRSIERNGQKLKVEMRHGHQFDPASITKYYHLGGALDDYGSVLDCALGRIPGLGNISVSGYVKRRFKEAINFRMDAFGNALDHMRQNGLDILFTGHTHMPDAKKTAAGEYVNDGDGCTPKVSFGLINDKGQTAVFKIYSNNRALITTPYGSGMLRLSDIGFNGFKNRPVAIEDRHTRMVDRIINLVALQWPSRTRQQQRANAEIMRRDKNRPQGELVMPRLPRPPKEQRATGPQESQKLAA